MDIDLRHPETEHSPVGMSAPTVDASGASDVATTVLRGLGEVAEDEADAPLRETYARLRAALGVAFVPTVFRMLASHGPYLAAAVDAVGPTVAAPDGRRAAEAMRAAAAELPLAVPPTPLDAGDELGAVALLIERYNAANPAGLMFVRGLGRGLAPDDRVMEPPLPPAADDLLVDIRIAHGGVTVPGLWRELHDGWPSLATAGWSEIRQLAGSDRFQAARTRVIAIADEAVAAVAAPSPAALAESPEATRAIERIVRTFQSLIPTMIVEIEWLRAALVPGEGR
jgi:hypothetical protein